MTFVFYDTETTGLDPAFDQVLQFAAVVTDDAFNTLEELNLRCRLQPHIVASPEAMHITRVGPQAIQEAPLSFYEMTTAIRKFIDRWTPATFVGFNSIGFDEKMLRSAFYQSLHPVYLTNTNGNSRMDVLRLAHAVAEHRPDAIRVPVNEKGKFSFRLGGLIDANGLALNQAHDALADTYATVALARFLKGGAPEAWDYLYACRSRRSVEAVLKSNDLVLITNRGFSKGTILAGQVARHPTNPAALAMFDLAHDPARYLDVDPEGALRLLTSSPRPIRILRANALPIIWPYSPKVDVGVDLAVARERIKQIRGHSTFAASVAKAMAGQYADAVQSPEVESQMYAAFPSRADERLMEAFHKVPWEERYAIAQRFEDARYRYLAERVIFSECPQALPTDLRMTLNQWRLERRAAAEKRPWRTISGAREELDDLKPRALPDDTALIGEIERDLNKQEAEVGATLVRAASHQA